MPVNFTIDDWKTIYEALYDLRDFYNSDGDIGMSANLFMFDNEDVKRVNSSLEKVVSVLKLNGVDPTSTSKQFFSGLVSGAARLSLL